MSRSLPERVLFSSPSHFFELLEPRIAPATIYVGAPTDLDPQNTTYDEAPFVKAKDSTDPGVAALFAGSDDHYVLTLAKGDSIWMFDPAQGYQEFVNVSGGSVLVFFFDKNPLDGGRVEAADLAGFSIGTGTRLTVAGSVDGDIIANFDAKAGVLSTNDLINDKVSVSFLSIAGSVNGSILTGGSISNVNIQGNVEQIATTTDGTYTYSFGGTGAAPGVGEATLNAYLPAAKVAGANITNVTIGSFDVMQAGFGGDGARGGSISKITVTSDYDGFTIRAGNGGTGVKAGAGGTVSNVTVYGAADPDPLVPIVGTITIAGGNGGSVATGAGAAGGAVSNIFVGYQPSGNKLVQSAITLNDFVEIYGGNGGNGTTVGGAGGSLSAINVITTTTDDPTPGVFETLLQGGNGGNAPDGRGGNGGNVNNTFAMNLNALLVSSDDIFVGGGDGGIGGKQGGNGGSINNIQLLFNEVYLMAGDGGDGAVKGGNGGSITRVDLKSDLQTDRVNFLNIIAGDGGNSVTGNGGLGGTISTLTGNSVDFTGSGNVVQAGSGGTSTSGNGGRGGNLSSIGLFEQVPVIADAVISFAAGNGGDGGKAGGAGGTVSSLAFIGYATLPLVSAGDGGTSTVSGNGGAGGSITNLSLLTKNVNPVLAGGILAVQAGNGGDGSGTSGRGGNGGSLNTVTALAQINSANTYGFGLGVSLQAGTGGSAGTGTVGAGGSITRATASASRGDALIQAGSAGAPGAATRGANGGNLTTVSASALNSISLLAGDSSLGGRGGNISSAAWYGVNILNNYSPSITSAPTGNVLIQAGQGSVSASAAGIGGSLTNLSGHASTAGTTQIFAGDGNGGILGSRAAAGGSINGLYIYGGTSAVEVYAGNGGSLLAATNGNGANGGNINNVASAESVNFRVLAAGNGGSSGAGVDKGRGGIGGSVTNVNIFGDIGLRSGTAFGIDGMGGIFAGAGGTGGSAALNGRPGNVTSIVASAISSIVAGRPTVATPETLQLAGTVDRITLRGLDAPTVNPNGSFTNFDTANFIGGISGDPTDAAANDFKVDVGGVSTPIGTDNPYPWTLGTTKPLDGLIASISLTLSKNFQPQAWLTVVDISVSGTGLALIDYRNDFNTNS